MRKLLLPVLIILSINTYAQKNLFQKINGEKGVSNKFTKLEPGEQVPFTPNAARNIFGLNTNSNLALLRTETDKLGITNYRLYQTYNDIPVENSMYIAQTKNGKLISVSGSVVTQFDSKVAAKSTAALPGAKAIDAALNYVHAEKYAWQDADFEQRIKLRKGNKATYYPVPSLVWYGGDDEIDPSKLVLAYKIDVYTLQPIDRKFIYVDANKGNILGTKQEMMHSDAVGTAATGYSGTQTVHSDLNGSSYRLRDYTKGNGIITLHAASGHADYTSASANWSLSGADKWALDAHFGVAATWSFYKDNFNRNSIDNAGFALTSWVNDASNTDNAYWDGSEMDYGNLSSNGNGVTAIDVTGHELTHGFTQYTSNLNYSKEPGAMNESMSDIMGKSVQFYAKPTDNSWILSNDMNWEIRSFSNPNADGQPDTYLGTYWHKTSGFLNSGDNYGVHTNSGVGNFMFYLLVTGGSGTNDIGNAYSVSGIGLAKADQILYRTNTTYLTPTSQYANWRTACISAATDLYGAGSNEVIQVENAWYAVGIGTAGAPGCTTPSGLTASAIANTTATLEWAAVSGAIGYNVQYRAVGSISWTSASVTANSYAVTGLTAGTNYEFQVQTKCSATSTSSFSSSFNFTTTGGCSVPTGLTSSAITTTTATVGWAVVSGATGYNLQYKASSAGTFTTVSNLTATSYNLTGLTAGTVYQYQVQTICSSGSSAYSGASTFTTSGGTITYCASKGTTTYEFINKVVLGSISNTSGNNNGYGNYTSLSTNLTAGSTYNITLTPGFTTSKYAEKWTVYIDYNQDGTLNGAGETVLKVSSTKNGTASGSFKVPTTAKNGATMLRIQMHYSTYSTNPCATYTDGEVEDYMVNISGGASSLYVSGSSPGLQNEIMSNTLSVVPNPLSGRTNANAVYHLAKTGNTTLKVVDLAGRLLYSANLGLQSAGRHNYLLGNVTNRLSSGYYVVVLVQDGHVISNNRLIIGR